MRKLCLITLILFLITSYVSCAYTGASPGEKDGVSAEVFCKSVTIRSTQEFNQLQNCTVVIGYVRIVATDFDILPEMELKPSNIEEITEYLLVYRAHGIHSLEILFPKLVFIRGNKLLYDEYALVIYENRNLQYLGLGDFISVLRGSIRIEFNPLLCFVDSINWRWILGYEAKYYYELRNNRPSDQCPVCNVYQTNLRESRHRKCWSLQKIQKISMDYLDGPTCTKMYCLTSCSDSNCRHCGSYISKEGCVDHCLPHKYRLAFQRQCVTNCDDWGLVEKGIECVEKCPKYFQEVKINNKTSCIINCSRNFVIHNAEDMEGLDECGTIDGSLTIELHNVTKPIVEILENTFRNLNQINGYLKILNSPQIITFHFLKNLHSIKGLKLIENRYSLYVVNNHYLQELFVENVAIVRGCIYFHLNPRLCYDKIEYLQKNFKECNKITITDVSMNSNGERTVCGQDIRASNATITDVNSEAAVVQVDLLSSDELLLLVGYAYYYKEAPYKNVTKYDGRHGCGWDGWLTDIVRSKRRRHVIRNLKPGTQYAYFVNSLTILDYSYTAEHVSDIQYFRTLPAKPSMVAKLYYLLESSTEIEIHWWPPRITNGVLDKYILEIKETNEAIPYDTRIKNTTESCYCPNLDSISIVPTPHAEDYYNKEQLLYRNSVMNFIYAKKVSKKDSPSNSTSNPSSSSRQKRNPGITDEELKELYRRIDEQIEEEARKTQEEDKEIFVLEKPLPICSEYDSKGNETCQELETFEDAIETNPTRHNYIFKYLRADTKYRISVRACVKDLENGCGAERVVFAQTPSESLEQLINGS